MLGLEEIWSNWSRLQQQENHYFPILELQLGRNLCPKSSGCVREGTALLMIGITALEFAAVFDRLFVTVFTYFFDFTVIF